MFFNVFIDPEIIDEARMSGAMGLGRLCDTLFLMQWDSIITDTFDREISSSFARKCQDLTEYQADRKRLGELIIHLWKKRPKLYLLSHDDDSNYFKIALTDAAELDLDVIISPNVAHELSNQPTELTTLSNMHNSRYAQSRRDVGPSVDFEFAESSFEDLCNRLFRKLVRHAEKVSLVDYSLGEHQDSTWNQENGVNRWVRWLDANIQNPGRCTFQIWTVKRPEVSGLTSLENHLIKLENEVSLKLELKTVSSKHDLPHQRYLMVEKYWVKVDRGFDLATSENQCRECSISYARRPKFNLS